MSTKKKPAVDSAGTEDELLPEYHFDYSRAKPNRFVEHLEPGAIAIVLDPDVAEVFRTAESVNKVLRALLKMMPPRRRRGK